MSNRSYSGSNNNTNNNNNNSNNNSNNNNGRSVNSRNTAQREANEAYEANLRAEAEDEWAMWQEQLATTEEEQEEAEAAIRAMYMAESKARLNRPGPEGMTMREELEAARLNPNAMASYLARYGGPNFKSQAKVAANYIRGGPFVESVDTRVNGSARRRKSRRVNRKNIKSRKARKTRK